MAQYKLSEQEMRSLAFRFAEESGEHPMSFYSSADKWFSDYIKRFNDTMTVIETYNQSLEC